MMLVAMAEIVCTGVVIADESTLVDIFDVVVSLFVLAVTIMLLLCLSSKAY